jgi:hypothetical protein
MILREGSRSCSLCVHKLVVSGLRINDRDKAQKDVPDEEGSHPIISKISTGKGLYRAGAFAFAHSFEHGRFEAKRRAARGSGLVTGFFLHRDAPRQEIDMELAHDDPRRIQINVYFNPGDDGRR